MSENIDFYNNNAEKVTSEYDSLTFEQVHGDIIGLLPKTGNILDVGCGSGRDALYFAKEGFNVTAIDASHEMLSYAQKNNSHENIEWANDLMPSLEKTKKMNKKYDFILLSAVWMHVAEKDRSEALKNLQSLMKPDAKMVISLRHGKFSDSRKEIPVSKEEVQSLSEGLGIKSEVLSSNPKDVLKRNSVTWESVCVQNTPLPKLKAKKRKRQGLR